MAKLFAALMMLILAGPAAAEYLIFQGEVQIPAGSDPGCSALSAGSYHVVLYIRNDGPRGIDGYFFGEKLVHAHIHGPSPTQLAMAYQGESQATHPLRLRSTGVGAFAGEVQTNALLAAIYQCPMVNAQIRINRASGNEQSGYQFGETQFQQDGQALQAIQMGLQGKVKEAIPAIERALAAKEALYSPGHPQLLGYYYFLGQVNLAEGSVTAAIARDRAALGVCEKSYGADSACEGAMLANLGMALSQGGIYAEAEKTLRRALEISDRYFGPESFIRGQPMNALGAVLMYTGRYAEAEQTLMTALALNKKAPKPENIRVGVSLNNLGVLYYLTGQYKKSEAALRQAVAIDTKAAGPESPIVIVNNVVLAQVLRVTGQTAAAEPIARDALATAQKLLGPERQDHPALGMALIGLADILRVEGRYAEAEPLYRQALANATKFLGADHPNVATISLSLAKLLHATGHDQEAATLLGRADVIAHEADSQMIAWQVAGELMQVYAKGPLENKFKAIFFGKEAVNDLQKLRGNLNGSGNEAQQAFLGTPEVSAVYRTLAGLLLTDGRPAEAQQVHTMVKEQEFYAYTERSVEKAAPKTVATLSASEKQLDDLNEKKVAIGKEYAALNEKARISGGELSAADEARLKVLRNQMDAAKKAFDTKVDEVAKMANDPEARKRRKGDINAYAKEFQGTLRELGHDAVVVQYLVLDDRIAIFFATPSSLVEHETKIKREDLSEQVRAFRKTLSSPEQDPVPQAKALYTLLIAPIADELRQAGAKTLMLDLDDVLRYLPFAALYDGQHYLVDDFSVVMVTEAVRDKLGKPAKPDWTVWGLGVSKGGAGYDPLPYADVELKGIAGDHGILKGSVKLDKDFTEDALRSGAERSVPIIHIASHFQFTSGSMDDSFLLLGDGTHMSLSSIKTKLDFTSVELLTLSACETAVGDDAVANPGSEVEGLGALAQEAGAKAVLATLWPVADVSTATLMRALYEGHAKDHLDKADALRHAQLALLHGTSPAQDDSKIRRGLARADATPEIGSFKPDPKAPFAHPFFWAPFILMGNWL